MKNIHLLFLTLALLCGCSSFEEQNTLPSLQSADELRAGFADNTTKTYIENGKYLRWHADDRLTAFFGNTLNRQYRFKGETGDNSGTFALVPNGELGAGNSLDAIYALYPYSESAKISDEGIISLTLPTTQSYAENSFGRGANTMVAVTENVEDTYLAFKNVCGYLKLKLYGNATIKSIEVVGNNNEKIAGAATTAITFGGAPVTTMAATATTSVTLDCGEGITLGTTADTATEFWIVLPETTFTKGLTIKVTDTDGGIFEKSTDNEVVITRNEIQPMAAVEVIDKKYRTIYYRSLCPNEIVVPYNKNAFDAKIISNTCDSNCNGEIVFDRTITQIGEKAFYFEPRTEGNTTFYDYKLSEITIPPSVTTIGEKAFYGNGSLYAITIPEGVISIGDQAFYNCWNIEKFTIPSTVTYLGKELISIYDIYLTGNTPSALAEDAFSDIGYFIYVPYKAIESYRSAWSEYAGKIVGYDFVNDVVAPANNQIYYTSSDESVVLPYEWAKQPLKNIITSNTYYRRGGNKALGIITFKEDITTLEAEVFYNCKTMTSVYIPESVVSITGSYSELGSSNYYIGAFMGCSSLELVAIYGTPQIMGNPFVHSNLLMSETPPVLSKFIGPLASSDGRCLITDKELHSFASAGITEYSIPYGVTTISPYAFTHCHNLKKITIPSSVSKIGYDAFNDCYNTSVNITDLTSWCKIDINNRYANPIYTGGEKVYLNGVEITTLTIPNNITTIKDYAFSGVAVNEIVISDNVTSIGYGAFEANDAEKITIGKGIKTIGDEAFRDGDDKRTKELYIRATTPPAIGEYTFERLSATIYVPSSSLSKYKSASNWGSYSSLMVGY